jgi:hypothetical protein
MLTDGQIDMTKLIIALRNFAKAPKNAGQGVKENRKECKKKRKNKSIALTADALYMCVRVCV